MGHCTKIKDGPLVLHGIIQNTSFLLAVDSADHGNDQ